MSGRGQPKERSDPGFAAQEVVESIRRRVSNSYPRVADETDLRPARARFVVDVVAMVVVLAVAALVRFVGMGSIEPNVMPDEADNAVVIYHILAGTGPGWFGLSWDGNPAFTLHLMALAMRVFGDTLVGLRMGLVVVSLVSIVLLYLIARQRLSMWASAIAALLFSTSLWYLNFSRNAWINGFVVLFALIAVYAVMLALQRRRWWVYYFIAGVAAALGMYGHFSGRLIIVALLAFLPVALIAYRDQRRRILYGYAIAVVACVVLFLPEVPAILNDWDFANRRIAATYLFGPEANANLDLGGKALLILDQLQRNIRGFLLMDGNVMPGFRYSVPGQALLDPVTIVLFFIGLGISLRYWRQIALWWVVPIVVIAGTQILSLQTPDPSRALIAAPFYFLFVGFAFDYLFTRRTWYRGVYQIAILVLVPVVIVWNFAGYVTWMGQPATIQARQPAVETQDFAVWQGLQWERAVEGKPGFNVNQWLEMKQDLEGTASLAPSPADVKAPVDTPTPAPTATATPTPTQTPTPSPTAVAAPTMSAGSPMTLVPRVTLLLEAAGSGEGQLNGPRDIAIGGDGSIYVADTGNHRIQKYRADGQFVRAWGRIGPGEGQFDLVEPVAVAVNADGNIVVLDSATGYVKTYTSDGGFVSQWGGPSAGMSRPRGLMIDFVGAIWIADTGHSRVLRYSPDGSRLLGELIRIPGDETELLLREPVALAMDGSANIYIADAGSRRILKLRENLTFIAQWPIPPAMATSGPHIVVTVNGTLLATDPEGGRLVEYALDGKLARIWGAPGAGRGQFRGPVGVEVAGVDVYVADTLNNRVTRLQAP